MSDRSATATCSRVSRRTTRAHRPSPHHEIVTSSSVRSGGTTSPWSPSLLDHREVPMRTFVSTKALIGETVLETPRLAQHVIQASCASRGTETLPRARGSPASRKDCSIALTRNTTSSPLSMREPRELSWEGSPDLRGDLGCGVTSSPYIGSK